MKKLLTLFAIVLFTQVKAQNILFVNDNDALAANTTSVLNALNSSTYSTYTYWSYPDSTTLLTSAYMSTFDLVIWYASTDGVGLGIWDGSAVGASVSTNAQIVFTLVD